MTVALHRQTGLMADRRISARIDEAVAEEMSTRAMGDGVPLSARIAALAQLWAEDDDVKTRSEERARAIAQQWRAKRYKTGT